MKIYIVEDEEAIRNELITLLERYGYDCISDDDFRNISTNILSAEPELVLLDINLPFKDGYEVCREIRKQSNVPIIVLTSQITRTLKKKVNQMILFLNHITHKSF